MSESLGIQSLDSALRVLKALSHIDGPVSLTELARQMDMPTSKVHRYLVSFVNAGLVQQAGRSGKYDLGTGALELGLEAMKRIDLVNRASDALADIATKTSLTALLSVWGNAGATVIRWERSANYPITTLGLGSTMPLLSSASGRMFLAYSPPELISEYLAEEQAIRPEIDADKLAANIREAGFSWVTGDFIPGLAAIAAPILNWQGHIEASVALIGTDPKITDPSSPTVTALKEFCNNMSVVVEAEAS